MEGGREEGRRGGGGEGEERERGRYAHRDGWYKVDSRGEGESERESVRENTNLVSLSPSHTGSYDFVIVRLVAMGSATTDRQCLLRSPFTNARSGVFFTIGCRSYVTLHDNLLFIPSGQL